MRSALLPRVVMTFAGMAVVAAFACGGGMKEQPTEPATSTQPPTAPAATPTAGATGNEAGRAPIFWTTQDNFATLKAGQSYKVLFRITGGYAEPTIRVTAVCQTCATPGEKQPIAFEPRQAQAGPGEKPGSYYPTELTLPFPGTWQVTVVAGADQESFVVEAAASGVAG